MLALRVSVGWHFYKEGAKKLQSPDGFTSASFLRSSTGPWADSFHDMARQPHDWDRLLAVPLEKLELDAEQKKQISDWEKEHKEELQSDIPPISPHTTYAAYAKQVSDDWKDDLEGMLDRAKLIRVDREALKKENEELIGKLHDELKKDLQALSKKAKPTTDDIDALKEKTTKAVNDATAELNTALDGVIDRFELDEDASEAEKKKYEKYTEDLSNSWNKQLAKLINSSYSEITPNPEEKPEEAPKTEPADSEASPETETKETEAADSGAPPEPEEEDSDATAAKPADTKTESNESETNAAEVAEPEAVAIEVTLPADTAYVELVEDWNGDAVELIDCTDPVKVAGNKYAEYRRYLLSYLAEIEGDLRKYQHELWRLEQLKDSATASDVPYQQARIAEKRSETSGMVAPWIAQINSFEEAFYKEAGVALGSAQEPVTIAPRTDKLSTIDKIVPYWHLIIGGGLILGLFSRLCGFGAAVFLVAVIATQPPWVAGAAETYYQVVELCGCLVLATIPTGRFAGLDFFVHSLFSRCCTKT